MAVYTRTSTDDVIRNADGAVIPNAPDNTDRAKYAEWLAAGGVPDPYVPPPPPPEPTPSEKLAAAGLTVAELRSLLGLPAR